MDDFNQLLAIVERLLAPNGCPWDREQTLMSMRGSLLEEANEVIEAINLDNNLHIEEELGDLFFNAVFLSKLAEKDHRFTLEQVLRHIAAKLIRRHPHIFGQEQVLTSQEVLHQWDEIKKKEKPGSDEIPTSFPALVRAQKIIKKKRHVPLEASDDELKLGLELFELVRKCQEKGIDAEQALKRFLSQA